MVNTTTNGSTAIEKKTGTNVKPAAQGGKGANDLPVIVPNGEAQPVPVAQQPGKQQLPIDQRLQILEQLNELSDRRENVKEALKNLNGFYIAPNGHGCNLKLTDSKTSSFVITHPSIIGEMVALITGKLRAELEEIENAIQLG